MNQLEAPVARDPRARPAAAESAGLGPPPAPSMALAKELKQLERPEVDHDDDEQRQQERKSCHGGDDCGNQRAPNDSSDDACEPMVCYDGFESVGKPLGVAGLSRFALVDDADEDVVNVRSPINCKPVGAGSACTRSATPSPTCVSALTRDEDVRTDEPSWTIQEFQEYLGMLELIQDVCGNSEGDEMYLSADSLGQMERLLTSLLPQGA
ncbi:unnamed protein product [Phytophthora fragariaefolia]|uniref:Unnamed protein product n=1 Tax=Phytophthora fragariaefolia TaxID=1490495 RepID=A0A9W6X9D7_9STRA|nr:unnamed protein product [Phytophthora fragariaefolia]